MASPIKLRIQEDVKAAMRAKDKPRLDALRLISAAIKQREVDERIELDDAQVLQVLDKMVKQYRESIDQFRAAGRADLVEKETLELDVVTSYLPEPLNEADIEALIRKAIEETGARSMQDMGKVMGRLRPQVQGRADMAAVSAKVRRLLS